MSLILCLISSTSSFAAVTALIDRNTFAQEESVTLTIESDSGGDPDFSVLQRDFEIVGRNQSNNIQIINGSVSRKQQWRVALIAKHTGDIVVPPLTVGQQKSQAFTVHVTATATHNNPTAENSSLFLEVTATPNKPYEQQQIIYTIKLYVGLELANNNALSPPKVTGVDAIVDKLGDNHQYETTLNGRHYEVIEQQYAIYPQKSGNLTIEPITFDGNVIEQDQNRGIFFDPFSQNTRHVRLRSKALNINVQSKPSDATGIWLPANQLQLSEQWSSNPPEFKVGEPITRTLTVRAHGVNAAQIPAVGEQLPTGFKTYPDQAELKNSQDAHGSLATRVQKIVLIPTQAGSLTLPAIELPWWNAQQARMEIARIPARTIHIAPSNAPTQPVPNITTTAPTNTVSKPVPVAANTTQQPQAGWWPWLTLAFACAWLVTLFFYWKQRNRPAPQLTNPPAPITPRLSELAQQLQKACQQNNAALSESALLAWAKARWVTQPPLNLTTLAQRCPTPLAEAIVALEHTRYARNHDDWQGEPLWQAFKQHQPSEITSSTGQAQTLQNLYLLGEAK